MYMYSAIAHTAPHTSGSHDTTAEVAVVLTTFDASVVPHRCCLLFEDSESITLVVVNSTVRSRDKTDQINTPRQTVYTVRQHVCNKALMTSEFRAQYAALTSSSTCPSSTPDYVRVEYPTAHPGVAVCVALAQPHSYTPTYVIEWFEVQKTLAVSKVVIYVLGNLENLRPVLQFYQDVKFLELREVRPREDVVRDMSRQEVVNLDCRQRLAGYHYVINLKFDEMVIPRRETPLYTLFQVVFDRFDTS